MTTDPTLQRIFDDGYDTAMDDLNMLMAQLTDAWGSVVIRSDK